jgi:signal transduction histidine kinase
MFVRKPRLARLVLEPTFAAICIHVGFTAPEVWRRGVAFGLLGALLAVSFSGVADEPPMFGWARWVLGVGLIVVTGGIESPVLPFMLITVLAGPSLVGPRQALALLGLSVGLVGVLALLHIGAHDHVMMRAVCMTLLLLGACAVGFSIREASGLMMRSSLEARDELLRNYGDRLRELTRLQGALAHELKNPLASIKGLAGLIQLEPERAPERLAVLRQEVARMQHTIDEFLSFSRPLTPLRAETTDARTLVAHVVQLHERLAAEKEIRLDMSQAAPIALRGDPRKMKQILMNLVLNAIEASDAGGTIEVAAARAGQEVRLAVLDRGPGLSDDLLERAVEPGVTTKEHGSGLGLTIARSLAEQHGGSLHLCNRDGGGLSAEVRLPLECPRGNSERELA